MSIAYQTVSITYQTVSITYHTVSITYLNVNITFKGLWVIVTFRHFPYSIAILIRVVKHILSNDCFLSTLDLKNGVSHTILVFPSFWGTGPHLNLHGSNFVNSIIIE